MSTNDRSRRGSTASPVPAAKALDTYFLEARAKLLDLAGKPEEGFRLPRRRGGS